MIFPDYVPAIARKALLADTNIWQTSLASFEDQLRSIEASISDCNGDAGPFRNRRVELCNWRDGAKGLLECTIRLGTDPRMEEAYSLLASVLTRDSQWRSFINAALIASKDYDPYRERSAELVEIKKKIAVKAQELAQLTRLFRKKIGDDWRSGNAAVVPEAVTCLTGFLPYIEVQSVLDLLRTAGYEAKIWPRIGSGQDPGADPAERGWTDVHIALLLDSLAKEAQNYDPMAKGPAGAALESRQKNRKMEYLRAFIWGLSVFGIPMTDSIGRAIPTVASVALNDIDVTPADVRRVISAAS